MSVLPPLTSPTWACAVDEHGHPISFEPQGGIVASADAVFAVGSVEGDTKVFAVSRVTGEVVWSAEVPDPGSNGSVSAPAIDVVNSTVIVASGTRVRAFALADGGMAWQAPLSRGVVNASPLVTTDRPGRNRLFLTDFSVTSAGLYCINVDPFDAAANPFQPGQILWRVPIGAASGATPAYLPTADGGRVFVGTFRFTPGHWQDLPGIVLCFPAGATTEPAAVWSTDNPVSAGFFGGVCVRTGSGGAAVYAASYAFAGDTQSANVLKLNATSGAVLWTTPSNRTDTTPVALDDGRVYLSAGIDCCGTIRNLSRFHDIGTAATVDWSTSENLGIGGRLPQVTAVSTPMGRRLLCAAGPPGGNDMGMSPSLFVIDPQQVPGAAGFITDQFDGGGGGAIVANGNVYAIGDAGLVAFGPAPAALDVDGDGATGLGDLYSWEEGLGQRDVDRNGVVEIEDRATLIAELRAFERLDMCKGRP
jgi:outer membrane protein assembly factor BamB